MNPPGYERDERIRDARLEAAAEIHYQAMGLLTHDSRNAALNELITFIERKYRRDNLMAMWPDEPSHSSE